MTSTNFHNTTNLQGDALKKKDASAKSQEVNIYELMLALKKAVEWWTRDALNREYTRRHGKRLKDQSISRALSNLSAAYCPDCKKYFSGSAGYGCIRCLGTNDRPAKLQKSATAMWKSDEGDKVHAWRIAPDPGQGDLFPNAGIKEGLQ